MNYQEFTKIPNRDEGCALFYKEASESKYHILLPLETIPTLQGDREELEYTYTTMSTTGKIKGRLSAQTATTDFYWHRDIVNKLLSLKDKQLDILVVLPDWQGYFARGEVSYSYNDISANDLVMGTLTITPSWIDEVHTDNVKDFCMDTAMISSAIDNSIKVSKTKPVEFEVTVDPTSATLAIAYHSASEYGSGTSSVVTATSSAVSGSTGKFKITLTAGTSATIGSTDIVKITTSANNYASDSTYIFVTIVE